jgi:hypothetical protein
LDDVLFFSSIFMQDSGTNLNLVHFRPETANFRNLGIDLRDYLSTSTRTWAKPAGCGSAGAQI